MNTVSIELYASLLLVTRVISMGFIFMVLNRQWQLFKIPVERDIVPYRRRLFTLATVILPGNLIPAMIDILTLFNHEIGRPNSVHPVSFLYTFIASITALLSSYLIWSLYQLSANTLASTSKAFSELERKQNG